MDEIEFLIQSYFFSIGIEREAQNIGQLFNHTRSRPSFAVADNHGNCVEAVEEKVRVETGLQCSQARAC